MTKAPSPPIDGISAETFRNAAQKVCFAEGITRDELTQSVAETLGWKIEPGDRTYHKRVNAVLTGDSKADDITHAIVRGLSEKVAEIKTVSDVVSYANALPEITHDRAERAALGFAALKNKPLVQLEQEAYAPFAEAVARGEKAAKLPEFKLDHNRAVALGFRSLGEMLQRAESELSLENSTPLDTPAEIAAIQQHIASGSIGRKELAGFLELNANQMSQMLLKNELPEKAKLLVHAIVTNNHEALEAVRPVVVQKEFQQEPKMPPAQKRASPLKGRDAASLGLIEREPLPEDLELFGKCLKAVRKNQGRTVEQLREILACSRQSIIDAEAGESVAPEFLRAAPAGLGYKTMQDLMDAAQPLLAAEKEEEIRQAERIAERERQAAAKAQRDSATKERRQKAERAPAEKASPPKKETFVRKTHTPVDGHTQADIWKTINRHMISSGRELSEISRHLSQEGMDVPVETLRGAKKGELFLTPEVIQKIPGAFGANDVPDLVQRADTMGALTPTRMMGALERALDSRSLDFDDALAQVGIEMGSSGELQPRQIYKVATQVLGYHSISEMIEKNKPEGPAGGMATIESGHIEPAAENWAERTKSSKQRTSFRDR